MESIFVSAMVSFLPSCPHPLYDPIAKPALVPVPMPVVQQAPPAGVPTPAAVPPSAAPQNTFAITPEEHKKYHGIFVNYDKNQDG